MAKTPTKTAEPSRLTQSRVANMTAGRAKKQAKKEKLKAALQARAAHARAARKAIRESAFCPPHLLLPSSSLRVR
ncbi:hypothetical protein CcaCcLH18_13747 [Colletotrichum camelliae]|nr:hypothetical protein CcaCcLH18_13747 [Colletotrichum camelliae]